MRQQQIGPMYVYENFSPFWVFKKLISFLMTSMTAR